MRRSPSKTMFHHNNDNATKNSQTRRCRRRSLLVSGATAAAAMVAVVGLVQPAQAWMATPLSSRVSSFTATRETAAFPSVSSSPQHRGHLTRRYVSNVDSTTADETLVLQQQKEQQQQTEDDLALERATTDQWTARSSLLVNGAIIGVLGSAAMYSLFHTHVEALAALWEYGLGQHSPDFTKADVAVEVMTRFPLDAIKSYEALIPQNPIFYKGTPLVYVLLGWSVVYCMYTTI